MLVWTGGSQTAREKPQPFCLCDRGEKILLPLSSYSHPLPLVTLGSRRHPSSFLLDTQLPLWARGFGNMRGRPVLSEKGSKPPETVADGSALAETPCSQLQWLCPPLDKGLEEAKVDLFWGILSSVPVKTRGQRIRQDRCQSLRVTETPAETFREINLGHVKHIKTVNTRFPLSVSLPHWL